jgi:hypothetical protein
MTKKKVKTPKPFGTFDIETKNWKDFLLLGYFDGTNYTEHESVEDFIKHCFSSNNTTTIIYAHFGGIFDFLFIIDFLFSQNSPNYKIVSFINQGRKILKFDLLEYKTGERITFIDSSGLFPFGLDTLTKSFDVVHKKLDVDVTLFKKVTKKLKKYLMYDCKGLHESLEKFANTKYIKDVGLQLTRSGTSFKVYKQLFAKKEFLPELPNQVKDFGRESYYGGRTEIFKPLYINKKTPLKVYDINSLYPSSMEENKFPSDFYSWTTEYNNDFFGIYHCRIFCPKDLKIPLLPVKLDGKLIFPTGVFDGHFTSAELEKAFTLGYKIEKIYRGALFYDGGYIFKDFINHFYNERKSTDDPVQKIIYKDIMNHLYGRLGINQVRECVSFEKTENSTIHSIMEFDDYEVRLYKEEKFLHTYSNPVLASFVTSYARIKLYEYMEKVNFDVYYCDTDSLFTPRKMESSKELGKMKLEYKLKEACFLLPKTYMGQKLDNHFIRKMKGFQNKNIGHITFDDFIESLSGEIRMPPVKTSGGLAGFKVAMKKGEILHVLPDGEKQLRHKYDKRIIKKVGKNYTTIPIHVEYESNLGETNA